MNQFKETKTMFMNAIPATFPLTYEGWLSIRDDLKAAALYVNFFDQITLAWKFAKSDFTSDEDAISVVMQYFIKNVPIIMVDKKKYNAKYLYRVAYNCMGCLRRVQRESDRYNYTTSNISVTSSGDEIDLFSSIVGDESDILDIIREARYESEIGTIIDGLDEESKKYIEFVLGGKKLGKRVEKKKDCILAELRFRLRKYEGTYCRRKMSDDILRFGRVYADDDNVKSAVVQMRDGTEAVHYGETRETANGVVKVVFFGPAQDYIVPLEIAKRLKVTDVELY